MGIAGLVSKAVAFLRAGYPTGAPDRGYVPLLALLRRRVTDDEITTITSEFMARKAGPVRTVDVGVAIFRITNEMPSLDDIARVEQRLDAIGCARR
ncbi:hypothetical protein BN1232_03300 [Mycobacterium lentiflavum]|uniref:DUF3349 domain-containing protein n=1 Tax=Mycobacterium lentiflavum TaxID=141349 RepID=A0A0E4GYD4_MYCLN|nr:DUF3349 domain-containing protein [Mycobacterium lentiflavum]MEE3062543.1 DUF3349 domain-containing protein [Actinomycetota bacterium]ULP40432.1 DUF3349 domain-containing protein [Mycobacterium lentiflavum]CQD15435.1 hypothetical protein BN1232_03300 [Mycobacterium lentiflavum]